MTPSNHETRVGCLATTYKCVTQHPLCINGSTRTCGIDLVKVFMHIQQLVVGIS